MIKNAIFIGLLLLVFTGCTSNKKAIVANSKPHQIIAGKINNAANKSIELRYFNGENMRIVADTIINDKGEFEFHLDKGMVLCQLIVDNKEAIPLVLNEKDSIFIETTYPKLTSKYHLSNSNDADVMNEFVQKMDEFLTFQQTTIENAGQIDKNDTAKINSFKRILLAKKQPVELFIKNHIDENPSSPANMLLAQEIYPVNGMDFWNPSYLTTLQTMKAAFLKTYPDNPFTKSFAPQIDTWQDGLEQYKQYKKRAAFYDGKVYNIAIGEMAPDIMLDNPQGKELKLSYLRGNYVLLDFWASWCSPCRHENPNVVRLYEHYKNKNFTVFSVSLDEEVKKWRQAIAQDKLSWKNHVSDLQGWGSIAAKLYKVNSIPSMFLIDPNGKIIGINLRGEALEQKLVSLLGK